MDGTCQAKVGRTERSFLLPFVVVVPFLLPSENRIPCCRNIFQKPESPKKVACLCDDDKVRQLDLNAAMIPTDLGVHDEVA